jgi:hypothetical protein
MLPGDLNGMIASVGVRAILCPTMVFAFMDGVRFLQNRYGPTAERAEGWSSLISHRHR